MESKHNSPKSHASVASVGQVSARTKKLSSNDIEDLHQELDTRDHLIPIQQLCQRLNTDTQTGMTEEHAAELLLIDGPNALSPPQITPRYVIFLKCMFDGFAAILWICAALCFFIWALEWFFDLPPENIEYFGGIIILICLISGFFAYFQESKNSNIMDSFNKMVPSRAMVIRDGRRHDILAEEIVLGDLVEIKMGDKIPADIRVTECTNLRVENSSITGEAF